MIQWFRSWFCKHEFEHVNSTDIAVCGMFNTNTHYIDTYICKKCGWIRKVRT